MLTLHSRLARRDALLLGHPLRGQPSAGGYAPPEVKLLAPPHTAMLCGKATANPRAAAEAQEEHRREDGEERRHRPPEREKRAMKRGDGK